MRLLVILLVILLVPLGQLGGAIFAWATEPVVAPVRGGPNLLEPLAEGQGRIISLTPGGVVKGQARGKPSSKSSSKPSSTSSSTSSWLKDGDLVTYLDRSGEIGDNEPALASITAGKKQLNVPNGNVILEDRLARSPDRQWAVFSAITACGDFCSAAGWLLGPGLRLLLTDEDFGVEVVTAWRPDGKEVAIGSHVLYVVSLPDGRALKANGFTAPAYGPDGRLYVRGSDQTDAVYEWARGGKPRKLLAMANARPAQDSESDPESDPGDPAPVTFTSDGKMVATFVRGAATRTRTLVLGSSGLGGHVGSPGAEEGSAVVRPVAVEDALALMGNPAAPPAEAALAAKAAAEHEPGFARELAVAANTRGYRLVQDGKLDDAVALLEAAANLDAKYGMPRYSLARIYALKGDAKRSVAYLRMLQALGKAQRARFDHAAKDQDFKKVADTEEFRALFP